MRSLLPKNYKQIGTCVQPHGTQGELSLQLLSDSFVDIEPSFIFVQKDGCMIPYPFVQSRGNKGKYILSVGFVSSMEEAEKLVGLSFYIDREEWEHHLNRTGEDEKLMEDELVGFSVIDSASGDHIGEIAGIMMIAENPLFEVRSATDTAEKENIFYIPIVEEWITNIDVNTREITMTLPDGLIS